MSLLDRLVGRMMWRPKRGGDDPISMVLLMRAPYRLTEGVLATAGERAFGVRFNSDEPMYFVEQSATTMMKVGRWGIHVIHSAEPYLGDVEEVAHELPQPEQQAAWRAHRGWVAFDVMNKDANPRKTYAVLAKLGRQLRDDRCAGVYLPREGIMAPAGESMDALLDVMCR